MYDDYAEPADLATRHGGGTGGDGGARRLLALGARLADAGDRRRQRILHQADWIAGQFSGRFDVTDENNA